MKITIDSERIDQATRLAAIVLAIFVFAVFTVGWSYCWPGAPPHARATAGSATTRPTGTTATTAPRNSDDRNHAEGVRTVMPWRDQLRLGWKIIRWLYWPPPFPCGRTSPWDHDRRRARGRDDREPVGVRGLRRHGLRQRMDRRRAEIMICEHCRTVFCWDEADSVLLGARPALYCSPACKRNAARARRRRRDSRSPRVQHQEQVRLQMCRERPKKGYPTADAAWVAIAELRRDPLLSPYRCPCGWWHLTSEAG